jgi:ribosome maturation factor RimP
MATLDDTALARVRELVLPIADELGVEVLDVVIAGARGRRVVRIVADSADLSAGSGLDVGTIATLSRRLGAALDEHDVLAGAYTLEVTSPGVDRPLRTARDFARNVGRDVRVVRAGDRDELAGSVVAADDEHLTLQVDGDEVEVPFADVDHGVVVLPW